MQIVKFNEQKHFPVLQTWFKAYEWPCCDRESLPENSFLIYDQETPVAFSYFAKTDSNVAIMGFTIANPGVRKEVRGEGLDILSKHILKEVENQGFSYLFYFADKNPMVERMTHNGMTVTDNGDAFILMKAFGGKNLSFWAE
jgi:hypothetical protein